MAGSVKPREIPWRGTKADEDAKWEMFHFGPKFLYQPEDKWPKTNLCRQPTAYVFAAAVDPVPEISHFFQDVAAKSSSWFWKLRRIAILRTSMESGVKGKNERKPH